MRSFWLGRNAEVDSSSSPMKKTRECDLRDLHPTVQSLFDILITAGLWRELSSAGSNFLAPDKIWSLGDGPVIHQTSKDSVFTTLLLAYLTVISCWTDKFVQNPSNCWWQLLVASRRRSSLGISLEKGVEYSEVKSSGAVFIIYTRERWIRPRLQS